MTSLIIVITAFLAFAVYVMGGLMLQLQEQKPIVASDMYADYDFVARCINSCTTIEQYNTCIKLCELFEAKHHDELTQESLYDLCELKYVELKQQDNEKKTPRK